jgi:hypothetical protein
LGILERLAQPVENMAWELEKLVEKKHTVVSKADFTRPWRRPTADEAGA